MPRRIEPEQLDHAADADARANLRDIEWINRWLGGERALHVALARLGGVGTVLDVAAGNGWAARSIGRRFGARVVSLDRSERNVRMAPHPKVVADARALPFADGSFDVVISNLFLHHLTDEEVVAWLGACARIARRAVVCVDLERGAFGERFLGWTRPLLRWHAMTVADGATSVRAAFRPAELLALAARAECGPVRLRRVWPWQRLVLSFVK